MPYGAIMRRSTIGRLLLVCAVSYLVASMWPGSPRHLVLLGHAIPTDYLLGALLGVYLTGR